MIKIILAWWSLGFIPVIILYCLMCSFTKLIKEL